MRRRRRFLLWGAANLPISYVRACDARRDLGDIPTMPWLSMGAEDAEAFGADMMAVRVVPQSIERMPLVMRAALSGAEVTDARLSGRVVSP